MLFIRALLAAALIAVPQATAAQMPPRGEGKLPPIGLPLPPIGLPLPPIGLPPPASPGTPDPSPSEPQSPAHPSGRGQRHHRPFVPFVVFAPPYWYGMPGYGVSHALAPAAPAPGVVVAEPPLPPAASPAPPAPATGVLRLDVAAAPGVEVYVDGYFAGLLDELGPELALEPGAYTVELRAAGYEPLTIKVHITVSRTTTYRGALTPSPMAASAPLPRSTLYYIPGCYLGNVHPREVELPPGCDRDRMIVRH